MKAARLLYAPVVERIPLRPPTPSVRVRVPADAPNKKRQLSGCLFLLNEVCANAQEMFALVDKCCLSYAQVMEIL